MGELTALPQTLQVNLSGPTSKGGERKSGNGEEGEGRDGERSGWTTLPDFELATDQC